MASAALSGDLERLKDIFESDDCSIFIQRPGVEEANLPDALGRRERVKQTSQLAGCVVVDGGMRIDGGFSLCLRSCGRILG